MVNGVLWAEGHTLLGAMKTKGKGNARRRDIESGLKKGRKGLNQRKRTTV